MNKFLEWHIPIHTVSEANCSEHWTKKKKRHDQQKKWIWLYFKRVETKIQLPCIIKLTRKGKKLLDDEENLPMCFKYVKDAIAANIFPDKVITVKKKVKNEKTGRSKIITYENPGQCDNDKRITWQFDQEIAKSYGIIISFYTV